MTNPVDEYLESVGTVKTAAAVPAWAARGPYLSELKRGAMSALGGSNIGGQAAGLAVAATAAYALPRAAEKIYRAMTKGRDFRAMMEHDPGLHKWNDENPALFNRHFTSLRNVAPDFTADPVIAATHMRTMSESPMSAGHTLLLAAGQTAGSAQVALDISTSEDRGPATGFRYQPSPGMTKRRP